MMELNWLIVAAAILGGGGLFLFQFAFGRSKGYQPIAAAGALLVAAAIGLEVVRQPMTIERALMLAFSTITVYGAIGFVSFRQPVHSALGFAVAVLASCGVYMLLSAPFIAVATTIIYAGATIIIFLFVLMFAQRTHAQTYDIRLSAPIPALVVSVLLLILLLHAFQELPKSEPSTADASRVAGLGRTMYVEYLWTVELAGALLLLATIGAIVIAQRGSAVELPESELAGEKGLTRS